MKLNNSEGRGRGSSFRLRALTLVGASALTLSGVGAAVFGASQAFATVSQTAATSSNYVIGSGSVGNLSVSSTNDSAGKTAVYSINFNATDGIGTSSSSTGNITVQFSDATPHSTQGTLTDVATGNSQPVTVTASSSTATVVPTVNVPAGTQVSLVFGNVVQGTSSSTANVSVATTQDTTTVTSADYTIAGTTPVSPTATSSSSATSASSTWTLGSFGLFDSSTPSQTTVPVGTVLSLGISGAAFTNKSVATITDTSSSGTPVSLQTIAMSASSSPATITTTAALNVGDTINISVTNVTNPTSAASVTPTLSGSATIGAGTDTFIAVTEGTAAGTTGVTAVPFPSVPIGTLSTVSGASISANPSVASSSGVTNTSTYTAGFTAGTTSTAQVTVNLQLAPGTVFVPTGTASANEVIVTDSTSGVSNSTSSGITTSVSGSSSTSTANKLAIVLPSAMIISKSDIVSVQVYGVANPTTSGSLTGQISTTFDPGTVSVSYSLTAATTTTTPVAVSLSSNQPNASATYKITNLEATAALGTGDSITIGAPTNTTFPASTTDYSITDLTNASGSGAPSLVTPGATDALVTTAANTATVALKLSNAISAGDILSITMDGVINPPTSSASNNLLIGDYFKAATVSVGTPTAPSANAASTMASGSLVQNGGTIYVIAGGVAFGIPTYADFVSISNGLGNPAVVQVTTGPSTVGTLASGTLVQVVGNPEVMVVGSNNTAYGFSTPSQFTSDGYSWSNVIQIPSLGNLTAGSAVAPSAASTMASGSLVQNGGTIYVIAGGVAFGIPTYSDFTAISAELGNPAVVQVSTAPSTAGTMASGTLVQHVGQALISVVSSTGTQVGFSTASEFTGDGYSWSNVIMIP